MEIKLNDYKNVRLKEIGDFKTSSIDKKNISNQKKVFMINYMDVYKNKIINKNNINELMLTTAKDSDILNNNLLKKDILFIPSSEVPHDIGNTMSIIENLNNVVFSYHLIRFRINNSKLFDEKYLNYCFKAPYFKKQLTKLATGSTRYTISIKDFGNVKFKYLIDINKQKMIGEFLSNIDRKIELINKEIYLNNELINVIDFFLNSKKLNVKNDTLSNNIKIQNGYAFNKNDLSERAKIGNNIIKISNIQNGIVKNDNDILFSNKNKENLEKYIVKKNDILIALSGATAGKVGIYNSIEFSYLNQRLAKLIPINLSKNFLSYLIFSRNFEKYVKSLYANSAQPNIKAEDILKFGFTLLSKNLQNSIGEFFFIFKKRIHLLEIKMKMELEYKKKMLKYLFDK